MFPAGERRKINRKIVAEENGIGSTKEPGSAPIPPASEKAPEITVAGAHPAIKAALYGNGSGEFRRNERDRDAPEKRNDQQIDEREARPAGGNHFFHAERAAGGVGEHHEDEVEETGFFCGCSGLSQRIP